MRTWVWFWSNAKPTWVLPPIPSYFVPTLPTMRKKICVCRIEFDHWIGLPPKSSVASFKSLLKKSAICFTMPSMVCDLKPIWGLVNARLNLFGRLFSDIVGLDSQQTPQAKLKSLVTCCKKLIEMLLISNEKAASADEFLPCLIYVCLKANPPRLQSNVNYITRFCIEDNLRMGEGGYYFASLVSETESSMTGIERTLLFGCLSFDCSVVRYHLSRTWMPPQSIWIPQTFIITSPADLYPLDPGNVPY